MSRKAYHNPLKAELALNGHRDFYVLGDLISGKLIVTLANAPSLVNRISVSVLCQEYCLIDERLFVSELLSLAAEDNFRSLIETCNANARGQFESNFSILLNRKFVSWFPPSFSRSEAGGSTHGVRWLLYGEIGVSHLCPFKEKHDIRPSLEFQFYQGDLIVPFENDLTDRWFTTSSSPLVRFSCPCRLPQWPERFDVGLEFDGSQETRIDAISIYLQKIITFMGSDPEISKEDSLLAQRRNVNTRGTNNIINVSCQINEYEPSTYSNYFCSVRYLIRIEIHSPNSEQTSTNSIDITPPRPRSRANSRPAYEKPECVVQPPPPPSPAYTQ